MSKFLVAAILLSLVYHGHGADLATAWDDKDFFRYCPPSRCSKHGPEIRFPLRLESSNTSSSCGTPCIELACSGKDTILVHPVLGPCKVTAIDYSDETIKFIPLVDSLSPCPLLQKLISRSIPVDVGILDVEYAEHQGHCEVYYQDYATLVCCSKEFAPSIDADDNFAGPIDDSFAGPISCLDNATHFSYLVNADQPISILPADCKVCSDGVILIPGGYGEAYSFKASAERILSFAEITLQWDVIYGMDKGIWCPACERQGRHCAFSLQRNQTFCMTHAHGIASSWPKVPYSCTNLLYSVIMF